MSFFPADFQSVGRSVSARLQWIPFICPSVRKLLGDTEERYAVRTSGVRSDIEYCTFSIHWTVTVTLWILPLSLRDRREEMHSRAPLKDMHILLKRSMDAHNQWLRQLP
jgi:hypothetical protein